VVLSPPLVFAKNSLALSQPKPQSGTTGSSGTTPQFRALAQVRVIAKMPSSPTYAARGGLSVVSTESAILGKVMRPIFLLFIK